MLVEIRFFECVFLVAVSLKFGADCFIPQLSCEKSEKVRCKEDVDCLLLLLLCLEFAM